MISAKRVGPVVLVDAPDQPTRLGAKALLGFDLGQDPQCLRPIGGILRLSCTAAVSKADLFPDEDLP